ncbi:MAG TPA: hypothetical protein VFL71_19360 [Actinomycetes bacterium]|jgi:hypothetical protein|nr:hypothetical protein [Actinomycetes bacterium]
MVVRVAARLIVMLAALGLATALLLGAMSMLTASAANAGQVLQRDQVGAVERGVARDGEEPAPKGSAMPAVALVFAGILLLATLPPAHRVSVYFHRPPGSYWQ